MKVMELKKCKYCGSTDGAWNEVCNFCFMIHQDDKEEK